MKILCAFIALCFLPVDALVGQSERSRLLGRWQLRLWVTELTSASAAPRDGAGWLELRRLELSSAPAGSEVYSVSYDPKLHTMLGPPRLGPAQAVLKDSIVVELSFNPFVDHGAFRLSGILEGDSIAGEWQRTNFADDGYRGAFTMVRRRTMEPIKTRPAQPYIVRGGCPFECCRYGEWQARKATPVYAQEGKADHPLFTLRAGDSVRAVTGNVHVTKLGRIKMAGNTQPGWAEFDGHRLPVPARGDTVYILSYNGEAHWTFWYRGLMGNGEQFWAERPDSLWPDQLLTKPENEWWVQVIDRRGRTGWVLEPRFQGADGCG